MAGDTVITVIGNLTADPELRFTPSGAAVANFTIASTPRQFDRQSNEWKDGETLFLRCSVWREAAENVAETFTKGTRVICQGRLRSRSFDTKEGERRTVMELEVEEVGPSLRFASAKINRNSRGGGGGNFGGGQGSNYDDGGFGGNRGGQSSNQQGGYNQSGGTQGGFGGNQGGRGRQQAAQQNDPWGQSSGGNYDWGTGQDDEPPF